MYVKYWTKIEKIEAAKKSGNELKGLNILIFEADQNYISVEGQ